MRLLISTPLAKVVDASDVTYVRAEDETGAFGILSGHADFLTTLAVSIVTWRAAGKEHHAAVRGGVLSVRGGGTVSIVTREAVGEATLADLGDAVLTRLRADEEHESEARLTGTRMEVAVMRQIQHYLAGGTIRFGAAAGPAPAARAQDTPQYGGSE